jgi:hypothetical protein
VVLVSRDRLWVVVDTAATVALLMTAVVVRSGWLWLVACAWAVLTWRQARLARRARQLDRASPRDGLS